MKTKTDIVLVIEKCFSEYCEAVGSSPCGCDACQYKKYITEEKENGCFETYKKDKMKVSTS